MPAWEIRDCVSLIQVLKVRLEPVSRLVFLLFDSWDLGPPFSGAGRHDLGGTKNPPTLEKELSK